MAISLAPLISRLPSKTKCEPNPKIGKEDALGVLIALVMPLLLFQGIPVEWGLNALKILKPALKRSDSSSRVTSKALISTIPKLLIGEINPGVTGSPFTSITLVLPSIIRLLPTSTIIFSEIRIS